LDNSGLAGRATPASGGKKAMPIELNDLRESSEFLNLLLDNIDAAVLVADENLQVHQFNKSFFDLFDRAGTPGGGSFGQIAGCVNAVRENGACGKTSKCGQCVLHNSLMETLLESVPANRRRLERIFYINGKPVLKYLEFSARRIRFRGRDMTLVIIYDLTAAERQKRELEHKQEQINQDLAAAYEIQKSLLPDKAPNIPRIRTAWRFEPCDLIGGDIFQIYVNTEEHISLYALDVCGHGVPAALVAVTVTQFMHSLHNRMRLTGRLFTPEEVMERLDKAFPLDRFDCYLTIAYATLNTVTGRLKYSSAGHVPPLILRTNGRLEVLENHGTVIGAGFGQPFGQESLQLHAGDRFILYTDGLMENFGTGSGGECKDNFYYALRDSHGLELKGLVDKVFEIGATLRSDQQVQDDMSLLAIEYGS